MLKLVEVKLLRDDIILGKKGDVISVRKGYARNYLCPTRTVEILKKDFLVSKPSKLESYREDFHGESNLLQKGVYETCVIIKAKSGKFGKLFGSINLHHIKELFKSIFIEKFNIRYSKPIKTLGSYFIQICISGQENMWVKVVVLSESE
ncbi:MAG: 50S ribosomal protein L9 [Deltaproteobacteria bacterium]|nr:MAG: 50S ribosomal protein L9 [Deltaproteobacteria bacterium]